MSGPALEDKIRANAPQIFFNLPAGALRGAGANDGGCHFREPGSAIERRGVAGAEEQFAMKLWNRSAIPRE